MPSHLPREKISFILNISNDKTAIFRWRIDILAEFEMGFLSFFLNYFPSWFCLSLASSFTWRYEGWKKKKKSLSEQCWGIHFLLLSFFPDFIEFLRSFQPWIFKSIKINNNGRREKRKESKSRLTLIRPLSIAWYIYISFGMFIFESLFLFSLFVFSSFLSLFFLF